MAKDKAEHKVTGRAKGGQVTAAKMTPEEKAARARKGAMARWGQKPLLALRKGNFQEDFGINVDCYVLDDAQRTAVISQTGMAVALGLSPRGNSFPSFINSQTMADSVGVELRAKLEKPLLIQWGSGGGDQPPPIMLHGHDAALLIDVCNAIADAHRKGNLSKRYEKVVQQAAIINGASAKSGIKGLVYALAGYRPEVEEVIQAFKVYVQQEAREYEREFPPQLYEHWYRLYHLNKPDRGRPWKAKYLTIDHVYHPLARSNGKILELTRALKASGGSRGAKLHTFLSELGVKALRTHLGQLLGIAGISKTAQEYEQHVKTLFGDQPDLPGISLD